MVILDMLVIGLLIYGMLFFVIIEVCYVDMVGYGGNGIGFIGLIGGIDWKCCVGENMVDVLIF